jgi:hypothetical protein
MYGIVGEDSRELIVVVGLVVNGWSLIVAKSQRREASRTRKDRECWKRVSKFGWEQKLRGSD